jgi:endonuclease/exonuclease/phosphatase family metal-dependent hydrolase
MREGSKMVRTRRKQVWLGAIALFATAALSVVMVAPAAADTPPARAQRRLRVATYNLFLGANLAPLLAAPPGDVPGMAGDIWEHVQSTDFRIRAEAIADLIVEEHPHLVGLQEVALWQTGPSPTAFTTRYDFLQILLDELAERGAPYEATAVNPFFTGMLPMRTDTTTDSWVRFMDRNAIIARADLEDETLFVTNPVSAVFQAHIPVTILGQPVSVTRGYATLDVQFRGKWVRFATTQPEAYSVVVRKLQAYELVQALAMSPYDVILAGDINSERDFAGDSYQILTAAGYTDVWTETMPGVPDYTASFGDDLVGPPTELDHTVDFVLRSAVGTIDGVDGEGEVIGEEPDDQTSAGGWPSDHAGVAVTVRILKP